MKTTGLRVIASVALARFLCGDTAIAQDTLIGTYTINYHDNCAGIYTDQSNPNYANANPYHGNLIPPGPIFISVPPGQYKLVTVSGAGCSVWSGDATNGAWYAASHNAGETVTINHSFGQIALYYWDWVPSDNDPNIKTTISVYRVVDLGALIGTYTVDYYDNCAGAYTDQSNPNYANANPYHGNLIPPGPIFISVPPGQYKLMTVSGAGCSVWTGDASNGTWYASGRNVGDIVTINHSFGQIALYYWDWFPSDNDPNIKTTISVYRVATFGLGLQRYAGITLTGTIGTTYDLQYKTDMLSTNWDLLTEITLTNSPYLYFDLSSPGSPQRFYRTVLKQ